MKVLSMVLTLVMIATPALADTSASQSQNNSNEATSSPVAQQSNVQVNNQQTTEYGFGQGITCQGPSVAVSAFNANSTASGYASSGSYGLNASFVMPVGGPAEKACNVLAKEKARQAQLDTCLTILKAGYTIDSSVDPDLAKTCSVLKKAQ